MTIFMRKLSPRLYITPRDEGGECTFNLIKIRFRSKKKKKLTETSKSAYKPFGGFDAQIAGSRTDPFA